MIKKIRNSVQSKEIYGRSYRNFNEAAFIEDIKNHTLADNYGTLDSDQLCNCLFAHIMRTIDKHCPVKKLKLTIDKPAYLTEEIISLMKERDKAFKLARRTGDTDSWANARSIRNRVAKKLRLAKREYILGQIYQVQGD